VGWPVGLSGLSGGGIRPAGALRLAASPPYRIQMFVGQTTRLGELPPHRIQKFVVLDQKF
jgi:hypothetical protein